MDKETEKMYKGLYHDFEYNPDDQRLKPFDRLKNLLKDGDDVEVDERIEGKLDYLMGNKETPEPNKKKWYNRFGEFWIWLQLKLFPNPNYNKYYKRKK